MAKLLLLQKTDKTLTFILNCLKFLNKVQLKITWTYHKNIHIVPAIVNI